ncbi:MAG: hypothetical protein JWL77_3416 [Chthonomonadaceae bacterium]|nr:hypothetical protein [Chthonomonadaceae bacterium]
MELQGTGSSGAAPRSEQTWSGYIAPFATAIGTTIDDVTERLQALVGEPGSEAIEALRNEEYTPFADIQAVLNNVPSARLRKAVAENLRAKPEDTSGPVLAPRTNLSLDASLGILPNVPDDASLLAQIKANPSLKVSQSTVILAVRAALAERCGYFQIPILLVDRMEHYAESLEEPVSEDFYKLRKLVTQRDYAEIYEGMPGVDGNFVSQKRRDVFLRRLDILLWPALTSFQTQLKAWGESWQQGVMSPTTTMALLFGGASRESLPPGMMQPPPTDSLRDAADAVNLQINKVFAGVGVPVALAMGYDSLKIKEVLENPSLPAQVGTANRDQMLRLLNVAVTPDYPRLEENLVRYLLAILRYPSVAPDAELGFLTALTMLGGQIPWDKLTAPISTARRNATNY